MSDDVAFSLENYPIHVVDGPYLRNGLPTPAAYEFAATLIRLLDEMRAFASDQHLNTYNNVWREDGEPTVSKSEFRKRLIEPSLVLYDEIGAASIYFGTSEMFDSHSIEVFIENGKVVDTAIAG